MMAQYAEERVLRGEAALLFGLADHLVLERVRELLVPLRGHLAMRAFLAKHAEEVLAVDDLRVVIHAPDARHVAGTRELRHRDRAAALVLERHRGDTAAV